jgi:hypothetical protein
MANYNTLREDHLLPEANVIQELFVDDENNLTKPDTFNSLDDNEQAWEISCIEHHRAF